MTISSETLVLFPSSGMGHLIPMVELAKLLIHRNFTVTIIIVDPPAASSPINNSFIAAVSAACPSISFHRLDLDLNHPPDLPSFQFLLHTNPYLSTFLASLLSKRISILALILDMFCTSALDVATELSIPSYIFFASGASALSAFVSVPAVTYSFKDLGETPVQFPGLRPIPASHMPGHVLDRDGKTYKHLIYHFERLTKADGIMINTFESLEPRAVKALTDGSRPIPPIYCVGPVVAAESESSHRHECLLWLDAQPKSSVVFLCFGSGGVFSKEQLRETAVGLEKSKQKFLWVVRGDLDDMLPEGFLKRVEGTGTGMVVKSWAPQAAVLKHESIGGFVSHCGWNSTLEAVSAGVAMIAWPLYAEQRMNKVFLVEEAKVAVAMEGYDKEIVRAGEVEMKVRWLMESEGGRELKERALAMKESAIAARNEGGSSEKAWMRLASALKCGPETGTQ